MGCECDSAVELFEASSPLVVGLFAKESAKATEQEIVRAAGQEIAKATEA